METPTPAVPRYSRAELRRFWKGERGEEPIPPSTRYPLEAWEKRFRASLLGPAECARRLRMALTCRRWYARNAERVRRGKRDGHRRTAWSG